MFTHPVVTNSLWNSNCIILQIEMFTHPQSATATFHTGCIILQIEMFTHQLFQASK